MKSIFKSQKNRATLNWNSPHVGYYYAMTDGMLYQLVMLSLSLPMFYRSSHGGLRSTSPARSLGVTSSGRLSSINGAAGLGVLYDSRQVSYLFCISTNVRLCGLEMYY